MLESIACQVADEYGWVNISEISRRAHCDRKTVRKYLNQEGEIPPKTERKQNRESKLDKFKPYIRERLSRCRNLSADRIMAEIVPKGYDGKITILRDFMRIVKKELSRSETSTTDAVLRYETESGRQAQADWGEIGKVVIDGKTRKIYAFVMVLSNSRMRFAKLTLSQDTETLIQCIQAAFEYFGGVPKELLLDNMKSVVINRGDSLENREYNAQFFDFSRYYGFKIRLCMPYQPQTKGKVERLVSYVKSGFAYGRSFASLGEANEALLTWLSQVNRKEHGTTHKIPLDELVNELPNMRDISSIPRFKVAHIESRKVAADSYLSYLGNRYSVPMEYAHKSVTLRIYETSFDVVCNNEIICNHQIAAGHDRVIRIPEHFEGLLAIAMKRNAGSIQQKRMQYAPEPFITGSVVQVQQRSLDEYDKYVFWGYNQ